MKVPIILEGLKQYGIEYQILGWENMESQLIHNPTTEIVNDMDMRIIKIENGLMWSIEGKKFQMQCVEEDIKDAVEAFLHFSMDLGIIGLDMADIMQCWGDSKRFMHCTLNKSNLIENAKEFFEEIQRENGFADSILLNVIGEASLVDTNEIACELEKICGEKEIVLSLSHNYKNLLDSKVEVVLWI